MAGGPQSPEQPIASEQAVENPQTEGLKGWLKERGDNYAEWFKAYPKLTTLASVSAALLSASIGVGLTGSPAVGIGILGAEMAIPILTVRTGVSEARSNLQK